MRSGIAVHGISGVGDKALSTTYNPSLGVVAPVDGLPDGLPTSILEQKYHLGRSNSDPVCSSCSGISGDSKSRRHLRCYCPAS